jgi:hypothetical protein
MVVAGTYGPTTFLRLFKKNFITEIIVDYKTPVFIAHRQKGKKPGQLSVQWNKDKITLCYRRKSSHYCCQVTFTAIDPFYIPRTTS